MKKEFDPDMVFCPSSLDFHQDHKTIYDETIRAFKDCTILGYNTPWNQFNESNQLLVKLTKKDLEFKKKLLKTYKSQSHRKYMDEKIIETIARYKAIRSNFDFGESLGYKHGLSGVKIKMGKTSTNESSTHKNLNRTIDFKELKKFLNESLDLRLKIESPIKQLRITDLHSTESDTLNWSNTKNIDWNEIKSALILVPLNTEIPSTSKTIALRVSNQD